MIQSTSKANCKRGDFHPKGVSGVNLTVKFTPLAFRINTFAKQYKNSVPPHVETVVNLSHKKDTHKI